MSLCEKETVESFDDLNLREEILRGIYAQGWEKPSPVQGQALPVLVNSKRDVIAQAQSGTGKTGTFAIGCLNSIDEDLPATQILVLAPTRELAEQICKVSSGLASYSKIRIRSCIGGTSVREDIEALRRGVHMVVGTPGRVYDMIQRRALSLLSIKLFVLDEADEMLDLGFREQIYSIFTLGFPKDARIGIFSATMPDDAVEISKKFMQDPIHILLKAEMVTLEGIRQYYVGLEDDSQKLDTLCDLYGGLTITQAIIYCNRRDTATWLTENMVSREFAVSCTHSDMSHHERSSVMSEFRSGATRVLITTDLLSRGIDVQQVSIVINYDLPNQKESYVHRIGRSGRFGRKGLAINFITPRDVRMLKEIESYYSTQIEELPADLSGLTA